MKTYTEPLDYLIENASPLFGEGSTGEVTLPGDAGEELPDFDFDIDKVEDESSAEEAEETPGEEASESESEETDEQLDGLSKELEEIKNKLSDLKVKYPEDTDGEVAKALDDATSAIDLAVHHLGDIEEDLPAEEGSEDLESVEEPVSDEVAEEPEDSDLVLDKEEWDV